MADRKLSLLVQFAASDRLSGSLRNIVGLGQTAGQRLGIMKREARDLDRELKAVTRETAKASGNVTALLNRERDLAARIERTNDAMERQVRLMRINSQADRIRKRGEDLRSSGSENLVTGVAMAAPMVLAAKQAMTFESAMADVRKVVDFENPGQFRQMSEDLLNLSTQIPMSAEGLASIVAAAGRAGVARKELLTFAQDAAQMGIAFDTTAEDAGGMMAKWRTAFGMGQDQVRTLSDQINALTNTYGGNALSVAGITTRIGALGKVAGVAAPQIAAMGQLMNSVGVEEEIAATGIKNMMLAMTKGAAATKSQKEALASLGLEPTKLAKAMQEDAGGAITDLLKRVRNLPKEAQAGALTELFGSESVSAIAPLLANLDELQKRFALVGDKMAYTGSMQKEYLARVATTEGATGLALNALKAVNITLGTMLLPTITAASQKIVEIANVVRAWAKEHPGLTKGLTMTWAAATGLMVGLGGLKIAFGILLGPFSSVFRMVATNGPLIARTFGMIRTAALFLGKGFLRAGLMMLANPMVLAIVAIVAVIGAAGYLIYKHWDTIKAAFQTGLGYLGQAWEWLKAKGAELLPILTLPLRMAGALVMAHWTAMQAAFAWGASMLGQAWTWIKDRFTAGVSFLTALPGQMLSIGAQIIQGLVRGITAAPGAVWNALKSIVMSGITNIKAFLGIKSPSRLFMGIGGFMTEGLAIGVERGAKRPVSAVGSLAAGVAGAMAISPVTPLERPQIAPVASAASAGRPGATAPAMSGGDTITINIQQQPGESSDALVRRFMAELDRRKANTRRGGFFD